DRQTYCPTTARAASCRPPRPHISAASPSGQDPAATAATASSAPTASTPTPARKHHQMGNAEKPTTESTTSLTLRRNVHPDCPATRGCLSYSTDSWRKPSQVIRANTL